MKSYKPYDRYARQILLKDFGYEGQRRLSEASVLVIGAGGLGCPALQYFAAAGVGAIGIVDDDVVSIDNLHRQILFSTEDIGAKKVDVAAQRLQRMNDQTEVNKHGIRLTNENAIDLFINYDYVLDASDNFATRYIVNDACVLLGMPLIYGAISQYEGQVAVFNVGNNSTNYRDLFPRPPESGSVLNCAEAGVLGVLPGIIGTLQATEVIKLLTGIGKPLIDQLYTYNALTNESYIFDVTKQEQSVDMPSSIDDFKTFDYQWFCEGHMKGVQEIEFAEFELMRKQDNTIVVDVREAGEKPQVNFTHSALPLSVLRESIPFFDQDVIVVFCQSGKRSIEAAGLLSEIYSDSKKIYSLKGGILNWINNGKEA